MSQSPSNTVDDDKNNLSSSQQSSNDNVSVFCREVRNLLRSKPNCMIPFSKFVPAYHNHYGRQLCVYQFGFTKLIELLESIPHVVQIVGDGTNRYITLTHREQIKRFASDLIKVVKSQPGKKLKLSQFSQAYELVLGREFKIEDYGTNDINVLLAEIWEGTINIIPIKRELADPSIRSPLFVNSPISNKNPVLEHLVESKSDLVNQPYITSQYPDAWFEIPKRERSEREIKRTKYFIWDCIELLSKFEPEYSIPFSKFIPSYHYYFNRQCKVSIFGFSKLIDLFESISPDVVEILDQGPGEEKIIKLAERYWARNNKRHITTATSQPRHRNSTSVSPVERIIDDGIGDDEVEDEDEVEDDVDDDDDDDEEEEEEDDADDDASEQADDVIFSRPQSPPIDNGPTAKELEELEDELRAYEEFKAIKRSSRMAALLDMFQRSIY